jgi:hypothetical protein
MTLQEIVSNLQTISDGLCIAARRPWGPDAEAKLVELDEEFRFPNHIKEAGYEYFLEVAIARDEVLGAWHSQLSPEQCFDVVLYYAENDAWPDWFNKFCSSHQSTRPQS